MKRAFPLYPLFLAAFPILSVYSANTDLIPIQDLWRPLVFSLFFGVAIWLAGFALLRSIHRAAAATAIVIASTFGFSRLIALAPIKEFNFVGLAIWLTLTLAIAAISARDWRNTAIFNLLTGIMVVAAVGQIGFAFDREERLHFESMITPGSPRTSRSSSAATSPDIYYIILDGYGRSDALKRTLGFDNRPFIDGLRLRGFYIADQSRSNYCQTELSLASSLNMDFIPNLVRGARSRPDDRAPLEELIANSTVERYFHQNGYRVISVTTGFPPIQFENADLRLTKNAGLTLLETALVQMTPIGTSEPALESMFTRRRDNLRVAFKNLQELAPHTDVPRLVLVHILAPHPPFVFGPNGEPRPHHGPFGYWDGSDYMAYVGSPTQYGHDYAGQATYIGKLMLETIDRLLASPGLKPILIIQGDHGSKARLDQNSLARTDVTECFQNLSSYYVPAQVRRQLYPGITPVNSFRVVLNALFDENLPLLPDRSWYSTYPEPYRFTDVTKAAMRQGPRKWPFPIGQTDPNAQLDEGTRNTRIGSD